MRVLIISGTTSQGIRDYVNDIQQNTTVATFAELPMLAPYQLEQGRQVVSDLLAGHEYDILHIQYDGNMFATNHCHHEHLENFRWLIEKSQREDVKVVVTMHGIPTYDQPVMGWRNKIGAKLLRSYWTGTIMPLLTTCDIVVHSYSHKAALLKYGCDTNVHVIPPLVVEGSAQSSALDDQEQGEFSIVIPGRRSQYKGHDHAANLISRLPDECRLYISDDGDLSDQAISAILNKYGVTDRVTLVTFSKDKDQYLEQLSQYNAALLPYTEDVPSSGSLNDCLNVGLYCLTSSTESFSQFSERYACTICCPDFALTGSLLLRRLLYDKQYTNKLDANIQNYLSSHTADKIQQRMINVYTPVYTVNPRVKLDGNVINVFMCCRDNQDTINNTLAGLEACQEHLSKNEFRYYILENDSVDDTPEIIEQFYKTHVGNFSCERFGNTKWGSHSGSGRMRDMAKYRNIMKQLCTDWSESQYSFIIDSQVDFDDDIMINQIEYLNRNIDVAMVTPYGTVGSSPVYYDRFAYRGSDGGQDIDNVHLRPHSAFGGFVCIRTPILERCDWDVVDGETSEHVPFCGMVRRHGEIAVDKSVLVSWVP